MSIDNNVLRAGELTGIIGRSEMDRLSTLLGEKKWSKYRKKYDEAAKNLLSQKSFPIQLDIELNASCNLKCPMCPISAESPKGKGKKTWFDFEFYKEIIDYGVTHGLQALKLNYINEPFIRNDLYEFIRYAKNAGVLDIYLSTNGLLLNEKNIEQIIQAGLTRIQISIDATTPKTYNQVRPGGNLAEVHEKIQLLIKIRKSMNSELPLIRVNFVKCDINEHELDDFIEKWHGKVEMIGIQEFVPPPITSAEAITSNKTASRKIGFKCSFPFKQLVINCEKEVLPCCTFWGEYLPLKTITKAEELSEIWESKELEKLRDIHRRESYFENSICRKCVEGE